MEYILSANNICKSFFKSKEKKIDVLKGISLELELNKITVLVGASGSGKSTLLHILSGLDKPDNGEVIIKNTNIFKLNDDKLSKFRNNNIGFVFQFHHLLPEFTAVENIAIPQMIKGVTLRKALKLADRLLEEVGLGNRIHHKPAELSGGEQQRVAVMRALVNNPAIIFADEPTGNLDSVNSEILNSLFINLKEKFGSTFLIATHNPELVKLADIVIEIKDGIIKS
ncbi:MAG: ABC transporter ATP-binding protein [Ignavibacteriales bacterium]|nr:ABC transporter ATP-binding protein [Ignavibacteriales bacterium]